MTTKEKLAVKKRELEYLSMRRKRSKGEAFDEGTEFMRQLTKLMASKQWPRNGNRQLLELLHRLMKMTEAHISAVRYEQQILAVELKT